jgi:hypothetical protein
LHAVARLAELTYYPVKGLDDPGAIAHNDRPGLRKG